MCLQQSGVKGGTGLKLAGVMESLLQTQGSLLRGGCREASEEEWGTML